MISADDIDAFTPEQVEAVKTLDEVAARMKAGAPRFTEASADEFPKVMRAALLWRDLAIDLWEAHQAAAAVTAASMGVFDRRGRETS